MDIKTLQYWHRLEHFYPYVIQDQAAKSIKMYTISDENSTFPNYQNPGIEKDRILYYKVYLGIFTVDSTVDVLERELGKLDFRERDKDDTSCFCQFTLNNCGRYQEDSFKISSYPWAIQRISDGKINMDEWDHDFYAFEKSIFMYLHDYTGEMTYKVLAEYRDYIRSYLNWTIDFAPYWLRIDRVCKEEEKTIKNQNENIESNFEKLQQQLDIEEQIKRNDLLNSFYIRDLESMIAYSKLFKNDNTAFAHYINHQTHVNIDIEHNPDKTYQILSPTNLPKGKWPSDFGARFMQQINVNLFLSKDGNIPLLSVNGPPGTGKTTLFKDVIAGAIVNRAIQMMELKIPNDAFETATLSTVEYKSTSGIYRNHIRQLKPEYKQFGMLVVSNNNGAVENITHELPANQTLKKRPYKFNTYSYFNEVSDMILNKTSTWAMNAAALGNAKNQQNFINCFWPYIVQNGEDDNFFKLNQYLKKTNKSKTKVDWENAKKRFSEQLNNVEKVYNKADKAYANVIVLKNIRNDIQQVTSQLSKMEAKISSLLEIQKTTEKRFNQLEEDFATHKNQIETLKEESFLLALRVRLGFKSTVCKKFRQLISEKEQLLVEKMDAETEINEIIQKLTQLYTDKTPFEKKFSHLKAAEEVVSAALSEFKRETNSPFRLDEYFVESQPDKIAETSPWNYQEMNECRELLFLEAMNLHKAFSEGSSYLFENLDALSKWLHHMISDTQLKLICPTLLQSLFLIVPVISTTFASVGNFLRFIPAEEIAYLLVDEAGQAMPQCGLGAIFRSKKAIVAGDPLQITPVVTLHDNVMKILCTHFQQEGVFNNKYTSMQTLADLANPYIGWRNLENQTLRVGSPLIVHNRCQKTVFNISNEIAYDNKMVFASKEKPGAVCEWHHVIGQAEEQHFVKAQAEEALKIAVNYFYAYLEKSSLDSDENYPSLFIISPFRSVRSGIGRFFRSNLTSQILKKNPFYSKKEISDLVRRWATKCIGTIHTFQGKEAEAVIICLGVDDKHIGAANWASEKPNILNVAITRSKKDLYIIGDKDIWGKKPYFQTALRFCENINSK